MIDEGIWKNEWTLLCERFRLTGDREPSRIMRKRYYEYLSPRMDTDEFRRAAMLIYSEREFFPRPADFLPGERGLGAAIAWEALRPLLRNSGSSLETLDDAAKRAVRAMGGLGAIGASESDLPFRRREFMELYESFASTSELALIEPTPDLRLARIE